MAHWFHRNPLKATSIVSFDVRGAAKSSRTQKLCGDLKQTRKHLLELISNAANEISLINEATSNYLQLLHGFIVSLDSNKPGDSKLRYAIRFRWTNTLLGNSPTEISDCVFEEMSILFDVAVWYTKHAAVVASKEEPTLDEAKDVHKCLKLAAGIFSFIRTNLVGKLLERPEKGTDMDDRVLGGYCQQCIAEAQEVTIARAIELKHSPSLIAALAFETAKIFQSADDAIAALEDKIVAKWRKYLQFKVNTYYAYAYSYHGEVLLAADKCGEAIKCLQKSMASYEKAEKLGAEYVAAKGAGGNIKPHEHLFFRRLGPVVRRTLDKCERENGFIYHQKVPADVGELDLKAAHGLVSPEEYTLPAPSAVWTQDAYNEFDISSLPPDTATHPKGEHIPAVKEAENPHKGKDPKTNSGCVIS